MTTIPATAELLKGYLGPCSIWMGYTDDHRPCWQQHVWTRVVLEL